MADFVSRCVTYYLQLRSQSKLILHLLIPMIDSNLISNPKHKKKLCIENIVVISEKFMLNKSDIEAEKFFKENFQNSVSAILTRLWDNLHILLN